MFFTSRRLEPVPRLVPITIEDSKYTDWMENGHQRSTILWVCGGPGCGKSVLSSFLSQTLPEKLKIDPRSVVYFFCDDKDERLNTAAAILRNLLAQLLCASTLPYFLAEDQYCVSRAKTTWELGMLWRVFERIMKDSNFGPTCLIVDALDECEEKSREIFLKGLGNMLQGLTGERVRIIVTSRPNVRMRDLIPILSEFPLGAKNLNSDIQHFVSDGVRQLTINKGLSEGLGAEIEEALIRDADGTFLWVSLVLDNLTNLVSTSPNRIRKILKDMPKTLEGVYQKILDGIPEDSRDDARKMLQWVVFAIRPLTLKEMRIAIAVQPDHTSIESMQDDIEQDLKVFFTSNFGPLLKVGDADTVNLVHQSAKDFLITLTNSITGDPNNSHCYLSITCLTYLSFCEFNKDPTKFRYNQEYRDRLTGENPFLDYAADYWPQHVNHIEPGQETSALWNSFWKLAQCPSNLSFAYQLLRHADNFCYTEPLQISAHQGVRYFVTRLLDEGADIDGKGGVFGSALLAAIASDCNEGMVRMLLEKRADVRIGSEKHDNALHAAVATANGVISQLILDNERHAKITEDILVTAIEEFNDKEIVRLLLDKQSDIQITEAVLTAAVKKKSNGARGVVELLLDRQPNSDMQITEAVLIAAAGNRQGTRIMKLLLSREPDIQITESTVTAVAGNYLIIQLEMVELLLSENVNLRFKPAALMAAAYFGYHELVNGLLPKYELSILREQSSYLIHAAIEGGVADILTTFLEFGGNHLHPDEHNWTAYMVACQSQNTWALERLAGTVNCSSSQTYPPVQWANDKLSSSIQIKEDGTVVLYSGMTVGTGCSVKGNHPFPPGNLGQNYFEVAIGEVCSELIVAVGFCGEYILQGGFANDYRFSSVYSSFECYSSGTSYPIDPEVSTGDVVGCGIDWINKRYFYTLNGKRIKTFIDGEILQRRLYPLVAFKGSGDAQIKANFTGPFMFKFAPATEDKTN